MDTFCSACHGDFHGGPTNANIGAAVVGVGTVGALASLAISAMEGAVAISRAEASRRTFDQVADELVRAAGR